MASLMEDLDRGIRNMDTLDVGTLFLGVAGSAVYYGFASVTIAGTQLSETLHTFGSGTSISIAFGITLFAVAWGILTNLVQSSSSRSMDGLLTRAEQVGIILSVGPLLLAFLNQDFLNWITETQTRQAAATLATFVGTGLIATQRED